MKKLLLCILLLCMSFATTFAGTDKEESENYTNVQFRPIKKKDIPTNYPKKPEYVPIYGYVWDNTLCLYGDCDAEAYVEIYNRNNTLLHNVYFEVSAGCCINLSESVIGITIFVRIEDNEYQAIL